MQELQLITYHDKTLILVAGLGKSRPYSDVCDRLNPKL